MEILAIRLRPGQDLNSELRRLVAERGLQAGLILTCVGSLRRAALRLADRDATSLFEGKFEIVSLVGTLSADGNHLHIALADSNGQMLGGHLMDGCLIYTTAEIVIGELTGLVFTRPIDPETTYDELWIDTRPPLLAPNARQ